MNLPEVVPDPLPQTVTKDEELFYHVYAHERSPKFVALGPAGRAADLLSATASPPAPPARLGKIPESQRKAFWVFLGGALVVIAAGIGGIVGGCIVATKLKRQDHSADARPSTILPPVSVAVSADATPLRPTSTLTSSTSTSASTAFANQTTTTAQPLPSFAFQGFAEDNYTGAATPLIQHEGFADLPFACRSYLWLPNGSNCCITFCENHTQAAGWRCDDQRQAAAATPFPRMWIGCGSSAAAEHSCL